MSRFHSCKGRRVEDANHKTRIEGRVKYPQVVLARVPFQVVADGRQRSQTTMIQMKDQMEKLDSGET
jgi:hypothetical protein